MKMPQDTHILVVDDEEYMREIIAFDLERLGFVALEDRPDLALHAGLQVHQGHHRRVGRLGGRKRGGQQEAKKQSKAGGERGSALR